VRLMLPSLVEVQWTPPPPPPPPSSNVFLHVLQIDTEVSPWHILVSELPAIDTDTLLSKLEIHFSKQRHGGGEVERCELLPDAHSVVIAFLDDRGEALFVILILMFITPFLQDVQRKEKNYFVVVVVVDVFIMLVQIFFLVAKRLTEKEHHEVALPHKKHKVRVTPFFNGKVTNLEVSLSG